MCGCVFLFPSPWWFFGTGYTIHNYHCNIMARSEARVLVSLPRHLQKYWYDIPMEPCLWEEKCFPVNQLIYYSNIAGWKVPAKPFRAIFCFERIPGGFEHGTVQILATSIQGEGQFCFFPTSHWTAVFWRTRWMRPFFLKFSFRLRSVLTSVCFFSSVDDYFSFIFF